MVSLHDIGAVAARDRALIRAWLAVALWAGASCRVTAPPLVECDEPAAVVDCRDLPELCALPVASELAEGDLARAVDIAFLPAGHWGDLGLFAEHVDERMESWRADERSIVGRAPALFNWHAVELSGAAAALDGDPLGACIEQGDGDTARLGVDRARARLAAANAPDVDVVVVVVAGEIGEARANATLPAADGSDPGVMVVSAGHARGVLDHELGHALAFLGDEYGGAGCFTDGNAALAPAAYSVGPAGLTPFANLTTDPSGALWAGVVDDVEQGGAGYDECVFHPRTDEGCRMHLEGRYPGFCPVCDGAIDAVLARFSGAGDDGAPLCSLELDQLPDNAEPPVVVAARGYDVDGVRLALAYQRGTAAEVTVLEAGDGRAFFEQGTASFTEADLRERELTLRVRCTDGGGATTTRELTLEGR